MTPSNIDHDGHSDPAVERKAKSDLSVEHYDLVIIGGGLVGATLAIALSELITAHSLKVMVIEASTAGVESTPYQPSFDERSSALAYGSRLHFERMGVWHDHPDQPGMMRQAEPISQVHVAERGRLGAARLRAAEARTDALGYVVPNAWMGQVLLQRAQSLPIEWRAPVSVENISPQGTGYLLELSDDARVHANLTVLADGGRSPLKTMLGIESSVHDYHQHALVSTVSISRTHKGIAYERFDPSGPMALLPLNGQRMALIWTLSQQRLETLLEVSDSEFLRQLQHFFGERLGSFLRIGERFTYPLRLVQAQEQVRPHLAILGNSAHTMHPVAGQGFNLALRGLVDLRDTLAEALDKGDEPGCAKTMHAFEKRRRRDRDVMVNASHHLVELFGIGNPLLSHARAAALVGFNLLTPLRHTLTRRAMGLER